jgi:hypothetical protein
VQRDDDIVAFRWEYATWAEVLQHHIGALGLGPSTTVILNAGLHRHHFGSGQKGTDDAANRVVDALQAIHMKGIWKTTTYKASELYAGKEKLFYPRIRASDMHMCEALGQCLNLSWTAYVKPDLYIDMYHFHEPVYRIINEDLLRQLGLLPSDYRLMNRSVVLQK